MFASSQGTLHGLFVAAFQPDLEDLRKTHMDLVLALLKTKKIETVSDFFGWFDATCPIRSYGTCSRRTRTY